MNSSENFGSEKPIGSFEGSELIGCARLWIAALSRLGLSEIDSYLRNSVE
jgi:hypothetical protein